MPKKGSGRPTLRRLDKQEVFGILDSDKSTKITAQRFGVSRPTVNKIRKGERYVNWYKEYHAAQRGLIESHLEALPFIKSLNAYYWLDDGGVMRIAFDDLLIKIHLPKKSLISIGFNTEKVKGQRLEYDEALMKLDEHGLITL